MQPPLVTSMSESVSQAVSLSESGPVIGSGWLALRARQVGGRPTLSRFPMWVCAGLIAWLVAAASVASAQTPPPEVWAKDMREELVRIDVTVKDMYGRQETRAMPVTVFRPLGDGRHPLAVFNHGRAVDSKRAAQGRARAEHTARYLVGKGFVVMVPTRIGYWETYGDFDPEESGPCHAKRFGPMSDAAADQVLATVRYAATLPHVDVSRWVVAGQSVGGLTTIATVARQPRGLVGGINFAGGAGGNPDTRKGDPCGANALGQYWGSLARPGLAPVLWLYWQNDDYWGAEHPRRWHQAWQASGGQAEFHSLAPTAEGDGHLGQDRDMNQWLPLVDAYLHRLGFTQPAIVARPPVNPDLAVTDVSAVPISASARSAGYDKFLAARSPRAFAVGDKGGWGYAIGDYVTGRALGFCQRSGQTCQLYAVDDDVVWPARARRGQQP
jgi:dienelactone hydrolase